MKVVGAPTHNRGGRHLEGLWLGWGRGQRGWRGQRRQRRQRRPLDGFKAWPRARDLPPPPAPPAHSGHP